MELGGALESDSRGSNLTSAPSAADLLVNEPLCVSFSSSVKWSLNKGPRIMKPVLFTAPLDQEYNPGRQWPRETALVAGRHHRVISRGTGCAENHPLAERE